MKELESRKLAILSALDGVVRELSSCKNPSAFDFATAFCGQGMSPKLTIKLANFLPSACGRAFANEIGMTISEYYQEKNTDGEWGPKKYFSDDSDWLIVEEFAEKLRIEERKSFKRAAEHSAEVNAISEALNSGRTLEDLKDAAVGAVFMEPLGE